MSESPDLRNASFRDLYRAWEDHPWSSSAIDLSLDAKQWTEELDERQRESALWNYAMFLKGVETEARTLSAVMDATPFEDARAFLATQIVDEARHRMFLDRWLREVAGQGEDPVSTLSAVEDHLTWGFCQVFGELERVADALRKKPRDRPLLTQAVALCHVIIEAVLAIPGEHFIHRYLKKRDVLPGLAYGLTQTARDEERHVAFGAKFLDELVHHSKECRSAAIEMFDRVVPWMVGVFIPPGLDPSYTECFDFTLGEIYAFGLRAFERSLQDVGINPREIRILARDDRSLPYEERARRLLVLIESGVVGDDTREPELKPEAYEILFEGMARAMDVDVARSLEGPLEWTFTDAEPWHLVVVEDHVEARPGAPGDAAGAALRFESASGDWAKIAVGRFDPRWALLRRRLRVHGSLATKAKVSKLFD